MAYVRENAAYSLQSIPVGSTVNAVHVNEAAKWANAAHQRGLYFGVNGTRNRLREQPALGYNGQITQTVSPKTAIAIPITIPEGYTDYTAHCKMRMPPMNLQGLIPVRAYLSLELTNGQGVAYPIFQDLTGASWTDTDIVLSGKLPYFGQVGTLTRAWVKASIEIIALDGTTDPVGEELLAGSDYVGFKEINIYIHKQDQC